jgi:hypothetical protein
LMIKLPTGSGTLLTISRRETFKNRHINYGPSISIIAHTYLSPKSKMYACGHCRMWDQLPHLSPATFRVYPEHPTAIDM